MRAGKLDERVNFQSATQVSDGGGGFAVVWTDQFEVWGGFSYPRMSARMEVIAAGAVETAIGAELIVRDAPETRRIKKEWRAVVLKDGSVSPTEYETWNIRKVLPRQRDGFIRFQVEAGVPT